MSRGGVNDNSSLNKIVGNTDISNVAKTLTEAVGNEALQTKSKTLSGAINETKQGLGTQCTFSLNGTTLTITSK